MGAASFRLEGRLPWAAALWGGDPWAGRSAVHRVFLQHGAVGWRAQGSAWF